MPDKGLNSVNVYISRPNPWFSRPFPIATVAVVLVIFMIWTIDTSTITNGVKAWRKRRAYLAPMPLNSTSNLLTSTLLHTSYLSPNNSILNSTHHSSNNSSANSTPTAEPHLDNLTSSDQIKPQLLLPTALSWVSSNLEPNFTSNLLAQWLAPGGQPCRDSKTEEISIPGLDNNQNSSSLLQLSTGDVHEFLIQALDENGNPRCLGGDYFETDLSGDSWKSRPPIKDLGNGSYSLKLQVHPEFSGKFNFTVVLLFRHYEGLKFSPERFAYRLQLRRIPINFFTRPSSSSSSELPELQTWRKLDFSWDVWSGRWTRHGKNDHCEIDHDGRYRCLNPNFPCQKPWCHGLLGSLESNGWVYSTHCSFRLFSSDSAWNCLQNRWIFFWGDSNHVDSIRNLLNFVLGLPNIKSVPRRFDTNFTNPSNPSQSVRFTSIFNGHWNETLNYQGLNSLQNEEYRDLLKQYFSEPTVPDTMIMNSGLHDGVHWRTVRAFAKGADFAAKFWAGVIESVKKKGIGAPELIYRTTIATGGYARSLAFNPQKMEAFNGVVVEKLRKVGILSGVVDDFDMTFPWHFDNRCNDGVHYGRAPAKARWRDGEIGHQYFVDLMLGHVLLNAMCAR